jgi:hypothetical protein
MWLKKATVGGVGEYQWSDPDTAVEVPDAFAEELLAAPGNDFTAVAEPAVKAKTSGADDTTKDSDSTTAAAGESGSPAASARGRAKTPVKE